ncbi:MAG: amidohydrolase family protein [Saprospiraceae bacterium]|nr:amidohydrolase family protein [Saprospiraceae bacterium]
MKKRCFYFALLLLGFSGMSLYGQETFPRNDVKDKRAQAYAFTHAKIITTAGKMLEDATMLIRDGKIEQVGTNVQVPAGYQEIDLSGKSVYPSFIDLHTSYGLPELESTGRRRGFGGPEQIDPATKGAYNANDAIKSHYHASEEFTPDDKSGADFRKAGFGTVLTLREDGIARGTGALVTLGHDNANEELLLADAAAEYSLNRGTSNQNYPRSMMGYVSLLRQTYLDADWYQSLDPKPFTDQALSAWIDQQSLPQIFDAGNWMNVLRADQIGDEFKVQYIIKGGGNEYQRIEQIKNTGAALIIPVNFPDAYDVEDPLDAERVTYEEMLHWELAPSNAAVLSKNGIEIAITSDGLKKPNEVLAKVRKAIEYGLDPMIALKALTETPAKLLNVQDLVGSLKQGSLANFIITDGDIFADETTILENWIQGKPYRFKDLLETNHSGNYQLSLGEVSYEMSIEGDAGKNKAKIKLNDTTSVDVNATWEKDLVRYSFKPGTGSEQIRLSGWKTENGWQGTGQLVDGTWINWSARKTGENEKESAKKGDKKKDEMAALGSVIYPFTAYGTTDLPQSKKLLIKNATVWTNEMEGILNNTDVLIENGKIREVGKNLSTSGAEVIDGTGKHITSGIIDEHTHIAGGGNDGATNSSMVRISDQLNSEDINIYRALAGGVTAAQVLHGSANPIGGQSAIIKLRWGVAPLDLKIKDADEFIKFALGENVKRSRSDESIRYPQTRMGVEQVYVDAFTNAREYEKEWKSYNALSAAEKEKVAKPRKDLVQEAMLEILNKERFITCHSYVQSEINMLMKVADQFGFNINTFTHILEGYKVADKMREHGVAASSFSDWWNYKWEVRYAIPYNAAILHREGVVTAINSDDANMGRRLNQEAAKSIKYGGLSEEEALKMVTLNPAKMLHLDDRMGSIKPGKDADIVLWTDHPLSVYARAEKTIVDGIVYFDIKEDQERRLALQTDRARIIQKMIGEKKSGRPTQKGGSSQSMLIHCESLLGVESFEKH